MRTLGESRLLLRDVSWDQVQRLLLETQSVSVTAAALGVPPLKLTKYLRAKRRRAWWAACKRRWAKRNRAARQARWRRGRQERLRALLDPEVLGGRG